MMNLFSCIEGNLDGQWSTWSIWSECSCLGTMSKARLCDRPKPTLNGKFCVGGMNESVKTVACTSQSSQCLGQ